MFEHLVRFNEWIYHTAAKHYYGLRLIYFKWQLKSANAELNRLDLRTRELENQKKR